LNKDIESCANKVQLRCIIVMVMTRKDHNHRYVTTNAGNNVKTGTPNTDQLRSTLHIAWLFFLLLPSIITRHYARHAGVQCSGPFPFHRLRARARFSGNVKADRFRRGKKAHLRFSPEQSFPIRKTTKLS